MRNLVTIQLKNSFPLVKHPKYDSKGRFLNKHSLNWIQDKVYLTI